MPFRVRKAGQADLDAVVALCSRYAAQSGCDHGPGFDPDTARRCLSDVVDDDSLGMLWVALAGGVEGEPSVPAGYLLLTWGYSLESGGREALIDEVYVERRDEGIGSGLLDAAMDEVRRRGVRRVFLETEADNEGARRFYRRKGFVVEDSIWMCRWSEGDPS